MRIKAIRASFASIAATLVFAAPVHAQRIVAAGFESGVGGEFLGGSEYRDPTLRVSEFVGGELSVRTGASAFTYLVGIQGERHALGMNYGCPAILYAPGHEVPCYTPVPDFLGARATLGVRYAVKPDATLGIRLGAGSLMSTSYNSGEQHAFRSIQVEWAGDVTDHITFAARAEQLEIPDYGGTYVRSRPVSFLLRLR